MNDAATADELDSYGLAGCVGCCCLRQVDVDAEVCEVGAEFGFDGEVGLKASVWLDSDFDCGVGHFALYLASEDPKFGVLDFGGEVVADFGSFEDNHFGFVEDLSDEVCSRFAAGADTERTDGNGSALLECLGAGFGVFPRSVADFSERTLSVVGAVGDEDECLGVGGVGKVEGRNCGVERSTDVGTAPVGNSGELFA